MGTEWINDECSGYGMDHAWVTEDGILQTMLKLEHSGSAVECLTRDRGTAGSSLTGVTVLCP